MPRVYSGVVYDYHLSTEEFGPLFYLDMPLSLVGDTLMLPLTIYQQINYGSYTKDCGKEEDKS